MRALVSRYRRDTVISPDDEPEKLIRMPIGFPEDLYEWMRAEAFRRRSPMAEIVREALRDYREKREPQIGLWESGER